jgi:hypothetical protein
VQPQGSKDVPIALLSEEEEETGGKRRTRVSAEGPNGKKKRRVVDIVSVARIRTFVVAFSTNASVSKLPFHPDLEAAIEELKVAITKGVY